MSTHFTHLDPNLFPNAMTYDPHRWLEAEKIGKRGDLEKYYYPFGKGSRNCIGIQYVLTFLIGKTYAPDFCRQ